MEYTQHEIELLRHALEEYIGEFDTGDNRLDEEKQLLKKMYENN